MNRFSIDEIARVTHAKVIGAGVPSFSSHIFYDSRKICDADGIFIALQSDTGDGHDFLRDAYRRGIRLFLVSHPPEKQWRDAVFLVVNNTLDALQSWAVSHRQKLHYPFVGITGTHGKTIVKEWLFTLFKDRYRVYRSPKSFNSQFGVALSILHADDSYDLALIEAGISKPGEMGRLEAMIQPDWGVLTHMGEAHAAHFSNKKQHVLEKLKLFKNVGRLILPDSDAALRSTAEKTLPKSILRFWGKSRTAHVQLVKKKVKGKEAELSLVRDGIPFHIAIPFVSEAYISNYIASYATARTLGMGDEEIRRQSQRLTRIDMRLELVRGENDTILINDAYNSDLQSLQIALDYLKQQNKTRLSIILSDILQSGKSDAELYRTVADLLGKYNLKSVVCVGQKLGENQSHFARLAATFYPTTSALLEGIKSLDFKDEAILIKGARIFGFEKVARLLQEKTHETKLEIDLSALAENLKYFRKRLHPKTEIMAMVKAFSYGSGSFEIANLLQSQAIDYLGVAYVDEGIALRKQGIQMPIVVLNPHPTSYDACRRYRLEPEIYSERGLQRFHDEMQGHDDWPKIHLKLNTGMNRLGFDEADLPNLIQRLESDSKIEVASVFSHLAASDDIAARAFTLKQINRFKNMSQKLERVLTPPFLRHILNSSGILNYPEFQFDMVRIGIGMYGFVPDLGARRQLRLVATLTSIISQIRTIQPGDTVGYGRHFKAETPARIATIPIGYADGLNRKLGNGLGYFCIHDSPAQIVGSICMDMTMVDVTDIDCEAGDAVVILGADPSLTTLAKKLDTIPYEILTSLSPRIKRRYFYG